MLQSEVRRLGGSRLVISTNIELRNDGLPYANRKPSSDQGAAVYFTHKGRQVCFACDRWSNVYDNIYAIAKTIEALRGIERWGTGDMVQQAFAGFAALPPAPSPFEVLGIREGASADEINSAFREKARTAHPDAGGSHSLMAQLSTARDSAMKAGRP